MRKSEEPSRHNTPYHRHDNRAVARYNQIPERGTSRNGPEGPKGPTEGAGRTRGGDAARRKRANPKQPQTTQEKHTKQQRETQTTPSKGQDTPADFFLEISGEQST